MIKDTIFLGTNEMLKYTKDGRVMRMTRSNTVGSHECKYWGNIRTCALYKLIDGAEDTLVDFHLSFEIGVFWIGLWNGIDVVTGTIQCHIWNQIHFNNAKTMACELSVSRLAEVDRYMKIFMV